MSESREGGSVTPDRDGKTAPETPLLQQVGLMGLLVVSAASVGVGVGTIIDTQSVNALAGIALLGGGGVFGGLVFYFNNRDKLTDNQKRSVVRSLPVIAIVAAFLIIVWPEKKTDDEEKLVDVQQMRAGTDVLLGSDGSAMLDYSGILVPEGELGQEVMLSGTVEMAPYVIDRFEVTNEQYRMCMALQDEAARCPTPDDEKNAVMTDSADELPVIGVTAGAAHRFCSWVGRRLPTDDEWLYAVRGSSGRYYPWDIAPWDGVTTPSNDGLAEIANVTPDGFSGAGESESEEFVPLLPVTDGRSGPTPDTDITHLLGNAWELTASSPAYNSRERAWEPGDDGVTLVVRGPGVTSYEDDVGMYSFFELPVGTSEDDVGFRCAGTA